MSARARNHSARRSSDDVRVRACPKSQRQEAAKLFPSDWWNQINYVLGFEERAQFATPEVQAFAAFVLLYVFS